eukprot:Hpha_TRINITY_DN16030_c2_g1::TRINITY_DN16030_c2_g1_i11::g.120871::m.120871
MESGINHAPVLLVRKSPQPLAAARRLWSSYSGPTVESTDKVNEACLQMKEDTELHRMSVVSAFAFAVLWAALWWTLRGLWDAWRLRILVAYWMREADHVCTCV